MVEVRRIGSLFRPYTGRLGAVLALIFVSAGLGIITPFLLRAVLDDAIRPATAACSSRSSPGWSASRS
jgi:ABC-type multidrug transport system fused ATPase/permease subunit